MRMQQAALHVHPSHTAAVTYGVEPGPWSFCRDHGIVTEAGPEVVFGPEASFTPPDTSRVPAALGSTLTLDEWRR